MGGKELPTTIRDRMSTAGLSPVGVGMVGVRLQFPEFGLLSDLSHV